MQLCIPQRLLQLFPCSQQRIIIPFHLLLSAPSLLPFHQEMESELRLMLPRRPTTLNSGRSRDSGRMAPLLPSLPNGRLKDCALSTADHPSSIKCSRHRRRRSPHGSDIASSPSTTVVQLGFSQPGEEFNCIIEFQNLFQNCFQNHYLPGAILLNY